MLDRLNSLLDKPLPATKTVLPYAILGDKGTIKHDCTQPTLIQVATFNKGCLFQKFYLSHPEVTSHMGENNTDLLFSSLRDTLGWSSNTIRERFCGGSFDGQYIKLNVPDQFAKKMLLRKEFTQKSITWDITHHIELASDDTKKTKLNGLKTSIPHFSLS